MVTRRQMGSGQGPHVLAGFASQLFGMGVAKTLVDGIPVAPLPVNIEAVLLRMTLGVTHSGSVVPAS